jgi:beta-lactamase superfamily II metal-dependent hydrolase
MLPAEKGDASESTSAPVSVPQPRPVERVIDVTIPKSDSSGKINAMSVATMVVWTDGQLSHFAAGDADGDAELNVAAWVYGGRNPFQSVRCVKLNHHGGRESTSREMIRHFRPRSMISSSGGTKHGHPRRYLPSLWLRSLPFSL